MKLNKNFIRHVSGDESLLAATADADFSGVLRGNSTTGMILELLEYNVERDDIVAELRTRFEAPEGVIEKDVDKVLNQLRKIGALDE